MPSVGLAHDVTVTVPTFHPLDRFTACTKRDKWNGKSRLNVSMVDIQLWILLWTHCPGHAGVKRNDRADRLAGKAALTSGLRLGRSKALRSLRHYLRARAKDITPSIVWRREAWKEEALDDLPWEDERGPSSIRRTLKLCQRQRWVNFWETG